MDDLIRNSAFLWLKEQIEIYGEVLPRNLLEKGFEFQGKRITLIGPQGIWKPALMSYPLSITTIVDGPYDDKPSVDGLLLYRYRGTNPNHPDNIGLRNMISLRIPLIYFLGLIKGRYRVIRPVFIVNDDPKNLVFSVAVDETQSLSFENENSLEEPSVFYRRLYITRQTWIRLHQQSFRERVMHAYRYQCTLCKLKHAELLDAAHIIGDKEELGDPSIQNGLSLCKIHHAAFDKNLLGITQDYIIKVREDILHETDGPMLKYGLQSLENNKIILPHRHVDWPDQQRLEIRYQIFKEAS